MVNLVIDTNILIDVLRKKKEALDFLTKCAEHYRPSISVVTIAEIMAGLRPEFYDKTKAFLDTFSKVEINEDISFLRAFSRRRNNCNTRNYIFIVKL